MESLDDRVLRRFLAGAVVPFKPRPGVPTLTIGGRKYVLSTDGGPLGDREDDADQPEVGEGGARIIQTPQATKWRYLWVYDTEKQIVAMWRATDGNEKVWGPARSEMQSIVKLDRKGQLNRVTTSECRKVESHMRGMEQETAESLKAIIEDSKGAREHQIDKLVRGLFEKLRPNLERELDAVRQGAIPMGFKPFSPENVERQAQTFVIGQFFRRNLNTEKVLGLIAPKIPSLDPELAGHYQDVQWAIEDVQDQTYDQYLPAR